MSDGFGDGYDVVELLSHLAVASNESGGQTEECVSSDDVCSVFF